MTRTWIWFLAVVGGLMLILDGLLWDAVIHSREHGHVAEGSLFNLSNPGHVVFGLGLVLTALIALAGLTVSWLKAQRRGAGWQRLYIPAALWLVVGLAGAITASALAGTG